MSTEGIGISAVGRVLERSDVLEPHLQENDKTISWDGQIFVYKDKSRKKDVFHGFISTQIKSSLVKTVGATTISHPFDVVDLKNYLHNGGVVLFAIKSKQGKLEENIYYKFLLPVDLKIMLDELKSPKQKKKSVRFSKQLSFSNLREFELECINFIIDSKKQISTLEQTLDIKNAIEPYVTFMTDKENFESYLLSHEHSLYGKLTPEGVDIFIGHVRFEEVGVQVINEVKVNFQKHYNNFEQITKKNEKLIKFGKGVFLNLITNKLSFAFTGTLSEQLIDNLFLYDALKNKEISFGKGTIVISSIKKEYEILHQLENNISYLRDIKALLLTFKIDPDLLSLDLIQDSQYRNLNFLLSTFVYKRKIETWTHNRGVIVTTIGNITLGVFVYQGSDKLYYVTDLFAPMEKLQIRRTIEGYSHFPISIYTILKSDMLQKLSNLDLNHILEDIKRVEYSEKYGSIVNDFVLELINAYDASGNQKLVEASEELLKWLISKKWNVDIAQVNLFQVYRRQRSLSKEEIESLRNLRDQITNNNPLLCGISILLENKADITYYFDLLTSEEKKFFIQFPIYHFALKNGLLEPTSKTP